MKKNLILGISILMLLGAVGCSSSDDTTSDASSETSAETSSDDSSDTEKVEISYVYADGDEGAREATNEIVNKFNESQDTITVRIEPGNGGAYNELLKTKDSVGEFPDVLEMRDTGMYVRAEKIAPLSDEITSLFVSTTPIDGEVYTAPLAGANTTGIIYNKAYFDENGLEEPTSYDEFLELCQTIEDLGDMSPLVVGGQDAWHMGFLFNNAYDARVMSENENFIPDAYAETTDFADPAFKASFEQVGEIMEYAQDGWASTPDAQTATFLVNDLAAMLYSGTHMFSQIEDADADFEIGWFPIYSPDGKLRLVGGGGAGGLAISSEAAADPAKLEAAEEFIKFFVEPENYKIYCELLNFTPTTVDAPDIELSPASEDVKETLAIADSVSVMWNDQVGDKELPPDFRNYTYKTLIEVLQGAKTIDEASEELNTTWDTSIVSFNPVTGVGME